MPSPRNCFNNEVIREPALARRIARKLADSRQVLGRLTLGGSGRRTGVETTAAMSSRRWPPELDPGTINARSHAPRALRRDGENRLAHAAVHTQATKMTGPTVRARSFFAIASWAAGANFEHSAPETSWILRGRASVGARAEGRSVSV